MDDRSTTDIRAPHRGAGRTAAPADPGPVEPGSDRGGQEASNGRRWSGRGRSCSMTSAAAAAKRDRLRPDASPARRGTVVAGRREGAADSRQSGRQRHQVHPRGRPGTCRCGADEPVASKSKTRASASLPRIRSGSSSGFTGSTRPARANWGEPAWGCRSSSTCRNHSADGWCITSRPGEGSTFQIRLPHA